MTWRVRRATLDDLDRLKALCVASVGRHDYAIAYLPWELLHSVVHIATDPRGRFVGMAVYRPVLDGSGWLAMARTHPRYRRRGVNRAIVESFVDLARRARAPCVRLWTNRTNAEGIGAFQALGFLEVARFTRVQARRRLGPLRSELRLGTAPLWRQIARSPVLHAGNRFAAQGWEFVRVDRRLFGIIASLSPLRGWGANLLGTPEIPRPVDSDSPLQFTVWNGSVKACLEEGRRLAAVEGRSHVGAYVPHRPEYLRAARGAGYAVVPWGSEAILCERRVPPGPPTGSARAGRTRS